MVIFLCAAGENFRACPPTTAAKEATVAIRAPLLRTPSTLLGAIPTPNAGKNQGFWQGMRKTHFPVSNLFDVPQKPVQRCEGPKAHNAKGKNSQAGERPAY